LQTLDELHPLPLVLDRALSHDQHLACRTLGTGQVGCDEAQCPGMPGFSTCQCSILVADCGGGDRNFWDAHSYGPQCEGVCG